MSELTPTQATTMAGERKLQDDILCGIEEVIEDEESRAHVQLNLTSSKTPQKSGPH